MTRYLAGLLGAALLLAGCGENGEVGSTSLAVAPAGSNAAVVSHTVPTTMAPGERRVVTVRMRNTGATAGTNDWTPSSYRLGSRGTWFGWPHTFATTTVAVGSEHTFSFTIQAPASAGSYTFRAQMYAPTGYFGEEVNVPVVVDAATTPAWACAYEAGSSTVPTNLATSETATVSLTIRNVGFETWPAPGLGLTSQDSPANLWNNAFTSLTTTVAPGATATFTFSIRAPSTAGSYSLRRQMRDTRSGSIGVFNSLPCVNVPITVGGTPALDASLVSQDFPAVMAPSEVRSVSVTMQNTGSETWLSDGNYILNALNNLWGITVVSVPTVTTSGSSTTLTFSIRAPASAGTYEHRWQLRKLSGTNAGFFGPIISVPMTVDAAATPLLDASVVAQTIPTLVTAGRLAPFTIEMQNTGTGAWSGSGFSLRSTNSPSNLWTTADVPLGAAETIAAGASKVFTFNVVAPATPGTYSSRWRMRSGALFGQEAIFNGIVVTLCGNNTIDAGEQCDDGNLAGGDGCTSSCQVERRLVDLATDSADRTLFGSQAGAQLGQVTTGDVNGDTVNDVVVSQVHTPPGYTPFRGGAGSVYGYSGGAGFFGVSPGLVATADTFFHVAGAEVNDNLGQVANGVLGIGDVTGDGVADVIVAATGADGVGNARSNSGEVYVLRGGAGLTGLIDLSATPAPTQLVATVYGANANDAIRVLAVADLTGDGIEDVVIGSPFDATNGAEAGAVFIVQGGASLTGAIDLSSPPSGVFRVLGPTAGGRFGLTAAVGSVGGSSSLDLLVASPFAAPGGRPRAGAVHGVFGPIGTDINLASSSADAIWLGPSDFAYLGIALKVGNVTGSAAEDVVIGANQWQRAGSPVGGVAIFEGGALGGTVDLSGTSPDVLLLGVDSFDDTGTSIALGDTNSDGFLEVLLSASAADGPANDRNAAGETQLVFGAASHPAVVDLGVATAGTTVVYGANATDAMGRHQGATALADIDGDGRADICIGSFRGTNGALSVPGRVDCFITP